ncbi:MAG TPA: hypothetical protein VE995_01495 [Gaiellaceae bacterium]|nr:hypothetical protein [Gaiellaceae bacterium]
MRVRLLHRDRDVDLEQSLRPNAETLLQDLGLDAVLAAMGGGDAYLWQLARHALLTGPESPAAIRYRQGVLADFLARPELARRLYALASEGVDARKAARFFWFRDTPDIQRQKALAMLELLVGLLERLRGLADEHAAAVASEGLREFFASLRNELDDAYLALLHTRLRELQFRDGVLLSARLGHACRGRDYALRRPRGGGLLGRLTPELPRGLSFSVSPRDEHGQRALGELRDRGLAHVANALAQATDHILAFFRTLQAEAGFYVACLNLAERLATREVPIVLPEAAEADELALQARGLRDPSLALHAGSPVVGNDLDADGRRLLVVTGANEGGKSTFLRSLGVAQLMLEAGMFVTAEAFRGSVSSGVYTHFKREEDVGLRSGKLDEELRRMREIAQRIQPHGLLLCNESFASTNEAEGSEIARQVVQALVEDGVRVAYVTHMYELARGFHERRLPATLCLRAERRPDGSRTYRILPGPPQPTSYGVDSYRRVFGRDPTATGTAPAGSVRSSR